VKTFLSLRHFFLTGLVLTGVSALIWSAAIQGGGEQADASDKSSVDEIIRKVARSTIEKALSGSADIDKVASSVGITSQELVLLGTALDINLPEQKQPQKTPPPVEMETTLANNYYEPDQVISYRGSSPYLLIVDKTKYKLHLLQYEKGRKTLVKSFDIKRGKNDGDKTRAGDNKTPEGVFFFTAKYDRADIVDLVGSDNAYQYGDMAFATNFPNTLDRHYGKNGSGIWLHGTDKPFDENSLNDTRGCVVTTNTDIGMLSKYITLYSTPIIIVNELNLRASMDMAVDRQKMLDFLESWRSSWYESRIDDYIGYYSKSFASQGMNRSQWQSRKQTIANAYVIKHINIENISIFKHNEGLLIQFIQDYSASNTSGKGLKTLYLMPEEDSWAIIQEQFRRL